MQPPRLTVKDWSEIFYGMKAREEVRSREDQKIFDLLDRAAKCPECMSDSPGGSVFGCESCLEWIAREVMET